MTEQKLKPNNIDEYIALFPKEIQFLLEQIRATIKENAPNAVEVISYQMPAFKLKSVLVYFAACKNHIGFYPTASGIENFKEELAKYKTSKGAINFPFDMPIPLDLISKIVKFRLNEDLSKKKTI